MKIYHAIVMVVITLLAPAVGVATELKPEDVNATLELSQETLNRFISQLGMLSNKGLYQPVIGDIPGVNNCEDIGTINCPGLSDPSVGGVTTAARSLNNPTTPISLPADVQFRTDEIALLACETARGAIEIYPAHEPIPWYWWVTDAHFTVENGSMTFTASVRSLVNGIEKIETRTVGANVVFDAPTNRLKVQLAEFKVPLVYGNKPVTEVDIKRLYAVAVPIEPQTVTVALPNGTTKTVTGRVINTKATYSLGRIVVDFDVGF
jgi:hypothetical protein